MKSIPTASLLDISRHHDALIRLSMFMSSSESKFLMAATSFLDETSVPADILEAFDDDLGKTAQIIKKIALIVENSGPDHVCPELLANGDKDSADLSKLFTNHYDVKTRTLTLFGVKISKRSMLSAVHGAELKEAVYRHVLGNLYSKYGYKDFRSVLLSARGLANSDTPTPKTEFLETFNYATLRHHVEQSADLFEHLMTEIRGEAVFRQAISVSDRSIIDERIIGGRAMIDGVIQASTYITKEDGIVQVASPHKKFNKLDEIVQLVKDIPYIKALEIDPSVSMDKVLNVLKQIKKMSFSVANAFELKFRKLGNYGFSGFLLTRTEGVYNFIKTPGVASKSLQIVAIDPNAPGSIGHELAHFSDRPDDHLRNMFVSLLKRKMLSSEIMDDELLMASLGGRKKYYLSDDEVFARGHEIGLLLIEYGYKNGETFELFRERSSAVEREVDQSDIFDVQVYKSLATYCGKNPIDQWAYFELEQWSPDDLEFVRDVAQYTYKNQNPALKEMLMQRWKDGELSRKMVDSVRKKSRVKKEKTEQEKIESFFKKSSWSELVGAAKIIVSESLMDKGDFAEYLTMYTASVGVQSKKPTTQELKGHVSGLLTLMESLPETAMVEKSILYEPLLMAAKNTNLINGSHDEWKREFIEMQLPVAIGSVYTEKSGVFRAHPGRFSWQAYASAKWFTESEASEMVERIKKQQMEVNKFLHSVDGRTLSELDNSSSLAQEMMLLHSLFYGVSNMPIADEMMYDRAITKLLGDRMDAMLMKDGAELEWLKKTLSTRSEFSRWPSTGVMALSVAPFFDEHVIDFIKNNKEQAQANLSVETLKNEIIYARDILQRHYVHRMMNEVFHREGAFESIKSVLSGNQALASMTARIFEASQYNYVFSRLSFDLSRALSKITEDFASNINNSLYDCRNESFKNSAKRQVQSVVRAINGSWEASLKTILSLSPNKEMKPEDLTKSLSVLFSDLNVVVKEKAGNLCADLFSQLNSMVEGFKSDIDKRLLTPEMKSDNSADLFIEYASFWANSALRNNPQSIEITSGKYTHSFVVGELKAASGALKMNGDDKAGLEKSFLFDSASALLRRTVHHDSDLMQSLIKELVNNKNILDAISAKFQARVSSPVNDVIQVSNCNISDNNVRIKNGLGNTSLIDQSLRAMPDVLSRDEHNGIHLAYLSQIASYLFAGEQRIECVYLQPSVTDKNKTTPSMSMACLSDDQLAQNLSLAVMDSVRLISSEMKASNAQESSPSSFVVENEILSKQLDDWFTAALASRPDVVASVLDVFSKGPLSYGPFRLPEIKDPILHKSVSSSKFFSTEFALPYLYSKGWEPFADPELNIKRLEQSLYKIVETPTESIDAPVFSVHDVLAEDQSLLIDEYEFSSEFPLVIPDFALHSMGLSEDEEDQVSYFMKINKNIPSAGNAPLNPKLHQLSLFEVPDGVDASRTSRKRR